MSSAEIAACEACGINPGQAFESPVHGEEPILRIFCRRCARKFRRERPSSESLAEQRQQYIRELDKFWLESGASQICGDCHRQGTGCCPPMCRYLQNSGCARKNVFCTSFVCSALLNAISECDPEQGKFLKAIKRSPGYSEFRIYEMVTRVPAIDREDARPLTLATHYPDLSSLDGRSLRKELSGLAAEVLTIRKAWAAKEKSVLDSHESTTPNAAADLW